MSSSLPTRFRQLLTLLAWFCLSSHTLFGQSRPFQAGTAVVDISPTHFPVIVNAMFTERSADKVVDPLFAKALTLDDATNRIVFCVVDSCMVPRDLLDQAKSIASIATGIPIENMMISATHTHSAPSAMGCLGSRVDPRYAAMLPARIAQAIIDSTKNLQPAQIASTAFDDWGHTFNRRWIRRPDRMFEDPFGNKNVRAHMHPGHESPDAVGPSGPVDPQLSFLALRHRNGSPIAVLANYSMHYYESQLLSSDYFGRFALHLANILQATNGFVGIMTQGTSGDLMWMDYGAPRKFVGYDTYAREIAQRVAEAYSKLQWKDHVPIRIAQRPLTLQYRVPDPSRLAWAKAKAVALGDKLPQSMAEIYALEAIHLHEKQNTELLLQAIRIGDLGIAALPNEVYAITGLKLKTQSPFPIQMNIELANGAEGYIPPPEQHRLGGYTTWPARTAGLETAAEPRIVETLLQLLEVVADKSRTPLSDEPGPYTQTVLKDRPFGYWRLNEIVTPSASDSSGNDRHAVIEDGVALYLPGVGSGTGISPNPALTSSPFFHSNGVNRAYHFAGGRLKTTARDLGATYSIELWFWNGLPHSVRSITGHLFSLGAEGVYGAPGEHLSIGGRAAPGRLVFANGGGDVSSSLVGRTELALKTWHHALLVRDGKRVTVFLNGDPEPEMQGEIEPGLRPDSLQMFFGGRSDNAANFEGKLDEIAVYTRGLNAAEAGAHFKAAGLAPPASPSLVNSRLGTPVSATNAASVLNALRPAARWLAPGVRGRTLLNADGQATSEATAEGSVELPGADAATAVFAGGRLRAELPGLGARYTVAFWFFNELPLSARPVTAYLFSRGAAGASGAPGDHLGIGGNHSHQGRLILFNGNQRDELLAGRSEVAPHRWHHVVLVRDGRRVSVFLNGRREPEISGELEPGHAPGVDQIFLGGRSDHFANLQGRMSDLAVFRRTLTAEDIFELMKAAGADTTVRAAGAVRTEPHR